MTLIKNFPLLIVPLIIYNLLSLGLIPVSDILWSSEFFSVKMVSGVIFALDLGGFIISLALFFLFIEILKATRTAKSTIIDHLLSTLVFIAYLVQFIIDPKAATTPYFICMVIAFLDVVAGYSISIRVASRDVTLDRGL